MAGISMSELAKIHTQINNFDPTSDDFDVSLTLVQKKNKSPLPATKNVVPLQTEIDTLQEEIEELNREIKAQRKQNKLLQIWQEIQKKDDPLEEEDIVKAKVQGLKHMVSTIRQITGVLIARSKTKIIKQGPLWVDKGRTIEGSCGDVEFVLDMRMHERMREDQTMESRITHLSISTSENIYTDLKDTIEQLSADGNAQGFLSLLPSYKKWLDARRQTFIHFTKKYPDIVSQTSSSVLTLKHPVRKCQFDVNWKFAVTELNTVKPDIQLFVHVPSKAKTSNVMKTAPENFRLMVSELGIESAIEALLALQET